MDTKQPSRKINHAFVTGATGLLGNNLVRALLKENTQVTALVRSLDKAKKQFGNLQIHFIQGDLLRPETYVPYLTDCDSLFHTAAFFRDSHKGGKHWQELYETNIKGTKNLLQAAYDSGIRQIVHTSSIAVLTGEPDQLINETMSRSADTKNEYYRSKILSDQVVRDFLNLHPDLFIAFVLPGSMYGPGDMGPTSTGQLILNYMQKKLPGVMKASYSVVDARDVADIHIRAMKYGRRGESYLAAGQYMTMQELMNTLEEVTGIPAPRRRIPQPLLKAYATWNEIYHKLTGKPVLVSKDLIELFAEEYKRTHFDPTKMETELGGHFRPVQDTMIDTIKWYRNNGYLD